MLHAERVSFGFVLGLGVVAGALTLPARSAPPLPPVITIAEPQVIAIDSVVQRLSDDSCPRIVIDRLKPNERATCVNVQLLAGEAVFVHVAFYTTEWWEHMGVVDVEGHTVVPFTDRPALYGDASIRLRTADLDNDGLGEVIATYGADRAVEVLSLKSPVSTLARVDAVRD